MELHFKLVWPCRFGLFACVNVWIGVGGSTCSKKEGNMIEPFPKLSITHQPFIICKQRYSSLSIDSRSALWLKFAIGIQVGFSSANRKINIEMKLKIGRHGFFMYVCACLRHWHKFLIKMNVRMWGWRGWNEGDFTLHIFSQSYNRHFRRISIKEFRFVKQISFCNVKIFFRFR